MNDTIVDTPMIRCPECGHVFQGEITRCWLWLDYTNECPQCGYIILESEIEYVNADGHGNRTTD